MMYGALSAIDIESEAFRCLGDFRFTIGAIRELIRMQSFRIKIAYLPFEEDQAATSRSIGKPPHSNSPNSVASRG